MRFRLAILSVLVLAPSAHAGVVRTLDGKSYQGQITFDPAGGFLINPPTGPLVKLPLSDLLLANFRAGGFSQLPSPWITDAIGEVSPQSSATFSAGVYSVASASAPDSEFLVHRGLLGDGEISARITEIANPRASSRAGLTIRDGIGAGAAFVTLAITPGGNVSITYRQQQGGNVQSAACEKLVIPYWLKLQRQGRRFVPQKSGDGRNWEPMQPAIAADLAHETQAGLFVASGDPSILSTARFDGVTLAGAAPSHSAAGVLSRGLLLRTGTTLSGTIQSADENAVTFVRPNQKPLSIPIAQVARLLFAPQPPRLPSLRPGVLLTDGDFLDGQFKSFADGKIRISSILFGIKTYAAGTQAITVVLSEATKFTAPFSVRLIDGTILAAESLQVEKDHLQVTDASIGKVSLTLRDIDQIRRAGNAFDSLTELTPVQIKSAVTPAYTIDRTLAGVPLELPGAEIDHALCLAPGTELTYQLDGHYRSFLCTLAVPPAILPLARIRLIIQADGQEIFRSPELTSIDDPLILAVNLAGKTQLQLRVESDYPVSAEALCADPVLVK